MKKIYKYPIPCKEPKFSVVLPIGFKFLRLAFQDEQLQMWCEFAAGARTIKTDFQAFGTGHEIPDGAKYLTTYDLGPFVFHLYQVGGG